MINKLYGILILKGHRIKLFQEINLIKIKNKYKKIQKFHLLLNNKIYFK